MSVYELMPILIPGLIIQVAIVAVYVKHCWENPNLSTRQKAIWIFFIAITNLLASVVYLIVTKPKTITTLAKAEPGVLVDSDLPTQDVKLSEPQNLDDPEQSPYSGPSQNKQAIVLFLIAAYEVFALRMIFENQDAARYPLHVVMAAFVFVIMLVIGLLSGYIRSALLRQVLPFVPLPAAAVLVYLDVSGSSALMFMAIVAILINSYPLKLAKVHFVVYFIVFIAAAIIQSAGQNELFGDQMIGTLYSNILFFVLVFAAFYSLKKQYILNARLESALAMTQRQERDLRELSVINERQRIIGEIHDTVGHTLTTAIIALEDASKLFDQEPKAAQAKIKLAQQQTRLSLDDLRGSIRTMQQGDSGTFTDRLNALIDEIRRTTELDINLVSDLKTSPLPIQQNVLLSSVKEFTTNSLKHGKSRVIDLLLQEFDAAYHLTIRDDGIGSDNIVFGFGLTTIRNRAESLGGTMRTESSHDEGFSLYIVLPTGRLTGLTEE